MTDRKLTSNTPDAPKDPSLEDVELEASESDVDPRLDNRRGKDRPPLETFPAKPQQIDGPDVANQLTAKEALAYGRNMTDDNDNVTRKGSHSPGPHGLGDTQAVAMEDAENVTVASERASVASDEAKTNDAKPVVRTEKKEAK